VKHALDVLGKILSWFVLIIIGIVIVGYLMSLGNDGSTGRGRYAAEEQSHYEDEMRSREDLGELGN
jgi:hypothetical protein